MSVKPQSTTLSRAFPAGDRRSFALLGGAAALWWLAYNNLQGLADLLTYDLMGLGEESRLGSSVNFFLYDVPKILLLLSGMIFLITVVRSFVTPEQTRRWLGGRREGVGNVFASLLGIITPFCSCSAVPLFIGFVESGRSAGRDVFLPGHRADGQRSGARAAVRDVRLEDRRAVSRVGRHAGDRVGHRDRAACTWSAMSRILSTRLN